MKRWCRVYSCWREAAEGSEFCQVKHGWQELPVEELAPPPRPRPLRRVWERDDVIAALQRWAEEHGRQPSQNDWARRGEYHPSASTASKAFGSWGAALVAAGFVSRMGRPPRTVEEISS